MDFRLMIFMIVFVVLTLHLIFLYIRINWLRKERIKIIDRGFRELDNYLSLTEMLDKWWIWDIEKLKRNK